LFTFILVFIEFKKLNCFVERVDQTRRQTGCGKINRYTEFSSFVIWPMLFIRTPSVGGADGWAKNQLDERRLGELFFGRQTIGRQQSFQKRRFAERRLGDKGISSLHSC